MPRTSQRQKQSDATTPRTKRAPTQKLTRTIRLESKKRKAPDPRNALAPRTFGSLSSPIPTTPTKAKKSREGLLPTPKLAHETQVTTMQGHDETRKARKRATQVQQETNAYFTARGQQVVEERNKKIELTPIELTRILSEMTMDNAEAMKNRLDGEHGEARETVEGLLQEAIKAVQAVDQKLEKLQEKDDKRNKVTRMMRVEAPRQFLPNVRSSGIALRLALAKG